MANGLMAIATSALPPAAEPVQEESSGDASDFASLFHSTMSAAGAGEGSPEGESMNALPAADLVAGAMVPEVQCPVNLDGALVSLLSALPVINEPLVKLPEPTLNEGMAAPPQSSSVVTIEAGTMSVSESTLVTGESRALPGGALGAVAPGLMAAGMGGQGGSLSQTSGVGNKAILENPGQPAPELKNMKPDTAGSVVAGVVPVKIGDEAMGQSSGLSGMTRHDTSVVQGHTSSLDSGYQQESSDGTAEEFAGELAGNASESGISESVGNSSKGHGVRQELPFGETVSSLLGQVRTPSGLAAGSPLHRFEKIQQLLDNVGIHVLEVVKGGGNQMTISLVPGELGRVLLSCQEKGHTVSVTVQAENQMACSLLQRQEDTVRTLLAEGGYELGRFEVGGWSGPQQEASGKQQRGQMFESDEDFLGEDLKRRNEGLGGSAKPVGASSMGAGRFWAVA